MQNCGVIYLHLSFSSLASAVVLDLREEEEREAEEEEEEESRTIRARFQSVGSIRVGIVLHH